MYIARVKRKGVFLIFSLWLFILLSLFCVGMGVRTYFKVRKVRLLVSKTRAFDLAASGLYLAKVKLTEDDEEVDYLGEAWHASLERKITFSAPKKRGVLAVTVSDEASRIPLTEGKKAVLERICVENGIENPQSIVNYILDYIDADSTQRENKSETSAKNEKIYAPQELLLLDVISKDTYDILKTFTTVFYEDERVNINTASYDTLSALIEDQATLENVLAVRLGDDLEEGTEDDGFYGTGGVTLTGGLENSFKTTSNIFRIESVAAVEGVEKKITCVLDRSSGTILYWYEK